MSRFGLRAIAVRLTRVAAGLMLGAVALFYAINLYGFPKPLNEPPTLWIALGTLALMLAAAVLPLRTAPPARRRWPVILLTVLAVLCTVPFAFSRKEFGNGDFSAILFTLRENRKSDLLRIVLNDFPRELAEHGIVLALGLVAAYGLSRSLPGFRKVWIVLCLMAVAVSNPVEYLRNSTIGLTDARAIDPARDFHAPVILSRPDRPRNLVLIYLESLERSYRDMPATAAAFAPFARLEDEGFSARHVQQISGTHFTAGGIAASQCGVPLFSRGVFDTRVIGMGGTDQTGAFAAFMPTITCLGDILAADGYTGHYLNGSDAGMFSIGTLLTTHGYRSVVGMATDPRWQDSPERNIWGVNDRLLFEEGRHQIADLAREGRPFFIALLTTGTHGPDGYPDANCGAPLPGAASRLPEAIACSAGHVIALLAWLDEQGLAETTTVAVLSDHLAMPNTLREEMRRFGVHRDNLFILLNAAGISGPRVHARPATTMDIFPTLLEAMGYRLQDHRANLGVSLLSDRPTLSERLGRRRLDRALSLNNELQYMLWKMP